MAAWLESPDHLVVDLRNISAADLAPLLDEETVTWRAALDWDFESSADLVRRFVGMQALTGFALCALLYFGMSYPLSRLARRIEAHLGGHR